MTPVEGRRDRARYRGFRSCAIHKDFHTLCIPAGSIAAGNALDGDATRHCAARYAATLTVRRGCEQAVVHRLGVTGRGVNVGDQAVDTTAGLTAELGRTCGDNETPIGVAC